MAHTTDGGTTWQTWTMPAIPTAASEQSNAEIVVNESTVLWNRTITRDGGRTWGAAPPDGATVAQAPDKWPVVWEFDSEGKLTLVAVDLASGQYRPLAGQPDLGRMSVNTRGTPLIRPAADGSLWVPAVNLDGDASPHSYAQVSRDRVATGTDPLTCATPRSPS